MKPKFNILSALLLGSIIVGSCKQEDKNDPCILSVDIRRFTDAEEILVTEEFKAEVIDGAAPYTFVWTGGTPHIYGDQWRIAGGFETISVTVTDNLGCVASDTRIPGACDSTSIADVDGNSYAVVSIGSQCWMAENLKVTSGLQHVSDSMSWGAAVNTPSWCYYGNSSLNGTTYGKLYNWAAVNQGNLCPAGWHMPTSADWDTLITYLGGSSVAGGKMKSTTSDWHSPNAGADNSSWFTALPGGYHSGDVSGGVFWGKGENANFWSSTANVSDNSLAHSVTVNYLNSFTSSGWLPKKYGYSCRCVKD